MLTLCKVQSSLGASWLTCNSHWLAHSACAQQPFSTLAVSVRGLLPVAGHSHCIRPHLVICLMSDFGVQDCRCCSRCAGPLVTGVVRRLCAGPGRHASRALPLGPPGLGLDCSGPLKELSSGLNPCCWPDCAGKAETSQLGPALAKPLLAGGALPCRLLS